MMRSLVLATCIVMDMTFAAQAEVITLRCQTSADTLLFIDTENAYVKYQETNREYGTRVWEYRNGFSGRLLTAGPSGAYSVVGKQFVLIDDAVIRFGIKGRYEGDGRYREEEFVIDRNTGIVGSPYNKQQTPCSVVKNNRF